MITIKRLLFAAAFALLSVNAQAANVFWSQNVTAGGGASCGNGTFAWDADSGTAGAAHKCWATTSGGTTAAAIPGSADIAIFDSNSGGGTVVVNAPNNPSGAAQVNLNGLTTGTFTGTLDYATNNNNTTFTITGTTGGFSNSGTGTRTITLGSGTFTTTTTGGGGNNTTLWQWTTLTNCTCTASAATMVFTNSTTGQAINFAGGGVSGGYGNVTFAGQAGWNITTANTFASIAVTAPAALLVPQGATTTITADFTWTGTSSNQIYLSTSNPNTQATISVGAGSGTSACTFCFIRGIAFTGAGVTFTGTNTFNLGGNTGMSITPPSINGSVSGGVGVPGTVL